MSATSLYKNLNKIARVQLPGSSTQYALVDYNGRELIAPIFNTSAAFAKDDYIIYQDELYQFTAAHAAGTWDPSEVRGPITVGDELNDLRNAISGGVHFIGITTTALYDGCPTATITINGSSVTANTGDMTMMNVSAVAIQITSFPITVDAHKYYYTYNSGVTKVYYCHTSGLIGESQLDINCDLIYENTGHGVIGSEYLEFIWSGSLWSALGGAYAWGELAFKDSAQGSYIMPTGSGTVTVPTYSAATSKMVTTSIRGVASTVTVSKMTAGTAKDVAKAGTAVRYGTADVGEATVYGTANKASSATTVGNANVGSAVSVAVAASSDVVYGTADVGASVTYGNANVGATVSGLAKLDTTPKTLITEGIVVSMGSTSGMEDCLVFDVAGTATVYGCQSTAASVVQAASSTSKLTPAKAADTTRKIRGVANSININPATTSTTTIYGAVDAPNTQTLTPAKAAPNNQTIIPAVSNGSITPWSESATPTVAVADANAKTVATGSLDAAGSGASVATGLTPSSTTKEVTVGTTSGTVTVK